MTITTISGTDANGQTHSVRIREGRFFTRYILCDTCGHREGATFSARAQADAHLGTHGVADTEKETHFARITLAVITAVVGVFIVIAMVSGE